MTMLLVVGIGTFVSSVLWLLALARVEARSAKRYASRPYRGISCNENDRGGEDQ